MNPTAIAVLLPLLLVGLPSDGGPDAPWGADIRLTRTAGDSLLTFNFAHPLAADEAARVHLVWYEQSGERRQVHYRRSPDGGSTWEPALRLSAPGNWSEHPSLAVSGNSVYVVWHSRAGARAPRFDVWLRRSLDGGSSWEDPVALTNSHRAAHATVAAQGETVQLVWGDSRDGTPEVWTRRSEDGGASWSEESRVSSPRFASWVPTVALAGDAVHVAWVDTRDGNEEEYYRRSRDGGRSWEPIVRLTRDRRNSWAPTLAADGERLYLAWFDQMDAPFTIYSAGTELEEALRLLGLEGGPLPQGVLVPDPRELARRRAEEKLRLISNAAPAWIAAGGDAARLRAILADFEAMGRRGRSYLAKERKLDEALSLLGLTYAPPAFRVSRIYYGDALVAIFADWMERIAEAAPLWVQSGGDVGRLEALLREFERRAALATTEWEIYFRRSLDGGVTWEPTRRLTFARGLSQRPSLAFGGDRVAIAWFDGRHGPGENTEVYIKESADSGSTWGADQRLTEAAGGSLHPASAIAAGRLHVAWHDGRSGQAEIMYRGKPLAPPVYMKP